MLPCPTRSMGAGECWHPCGALVSIREMIRVFERTGIGHEFFSSRPQYGILEPRISRSNRFVRAPSSRGAVFEGRLQRPSPGLIRSAPRRERVWGLSETSENLLNNCILKLHSPAFFWILMSAELEQTKHGKLFVN